MEHINIEIKGNVIKYAELRAEQGYCFYDIDDTEKNYIESIATPILDESELARKFVVIQGNVEDLSKNILQ